MLAVDVVLADGSVDDARRARARPARLRPPRAASSAARARWASRRGSRCGWCPTRPAVRTLLLDFTSVDDAGATVSGIIAAGVVPAALEMMDAEITASGRGLRRRRATHATRPRCCSSSSTGSPDGVDAQVAIVERVGRAHGVRTVRVAADEAERALLWKGRKSAFGALARIAPDYYLHDAVVPRTQLVDVLRQVCAIAAEQQLTIMNVFHAGDGNLHPLIVFDAARSRASGRGSSAPATRSSPRASPPGGVLSGEHGIGLEKRDAMPLVFGPDDLDAQARLRDAFDPSGRANPTKVLPVREPVRRAPADPRRGVGVTAVVAAAPRRHRRAARQRWRGHVGGRGRRPHAVGGRRRAATRTRSRCRAPAGIVDVRPDATSP